MPSKYNQMMTCAFNSWGYLNEIHRKCSKHDVYSVNYLSKGILISLEHNVAKQTCAKSKTLLMELTFGLEYLTRFLLVLFPSSLVHGSFVEQVRR